MWNPTQVVGAGFSACALLLWAIAVSVSFSYLSHEMGELRTDIATENARADEIRLQLQTSYGEISAEISRVEADLRLADLAIHTNATTEFASLTELHTNNSAAITALIPYATRKIAYLTHEKPTGTDGGDLLAGAMRTVPLTNLYDADSIGVTLSSNQFTLPAGEYRLVMRANLFSSRENLARLYDVTNALTVREFLSGYIWTDTRSFSEIEHLVLTAPTTYELQAQATLSYAGAGMGAYHTAPEINVYARIIIYYSPGSP